ncbi:hypothetical protein DEU56DRAFT_735144 [Suillus clintonianus]|uniref:uncharacterized protein n=1 Tax=Suillus clintonianus TaxID=1904413 RepID=UPI001B8639C9|nr:uncharacterized protein DEU56DRAFT_735144 [Suillus clintonianus]KAG2140120.1 hypothetical protein DEU56DRAFT_735144 [Suillus clintonianus]
MSTITLIQLPPEILCHVLAFLDAYDLMRIRKTSKRLKEIVDDSEMLQYTIDLSYFQMIPVGPSETDVPPATLRKQLGLYNAAWQRAEYEWKCSLPSLMLGQIYAFGGGIYGSAGENCISFARLPSASDSGDLYYWSHPVDVPALVDFTFCAAQDLLIIVSRPPDLQSYVYDVHLRSLTTNDTHPDAAQPSLKALDEDDVGRRILDPIGHVKVQIVGNYISMLCRDAIGSMGNVLDCIQLWDWKSEEGYQFILLFDCGISDCSFITEDRFLALVASGTVEIYSIADKSKPPQCTARISLPSLMDDFLYTDMFTNDNPTPDSTFPYSRKSYLQPSCSFHPSMDDQLIAILVCVTPRSNTNDLLFCRFVVRRSAILELEGLFARTYDQSSSNGSRLLWSTWGPQHAAWFRVRQNEYWQPSHYGFRTVEVIDGSPFHSSDSDEARRLCIRDFNPHIAWNYGAVDMPGFYDRIVRGEVDRMISYPFTEPLGSALTYREVFSDRLFDGAEILMDESRILLVKVSRNLPLVPCIDNELW